MKSLLNWIVKGSIGTFRVAYFLAAVGVILAASYILGGYDFLTQGIWGSDMPFAYSIAVWVDKYFPHVPFWYPLSGAGYSIIHSYPTFSFQLAALLKRLTGLELAQAFRLLGFSSVPLMALGIYLFVATRFKNQTAALIASVFYLISPIAWTWLLNWGFYAECVSHIFVVPAIIFWDLFFGSFVTIAKGNVLRVTGAGGPPSSARTPPRGGGRRTGESSWQDPQEIPTGIKTRLYLALTVVFLSLATLSHYGTGLGLLGFFAFYMIGYTLRCSNRKRVFTRGLLAWFLVGGLVFAVTSSTITPFYRYRKIAVQAGISGSKSLEELQQAELSLGHLLGFQPAEEESFLYSHRNIAFSMIVSSFAVLGIIVALFSAVFSTKAGLGARYLTLALFAVFALVLSTKSSAAFWMGQHIPWPLSATFSSRFLFVTLRFLLPTLGALGAVEIFKSPFFWVKNRPLKFVRNLLASLAGLAFVSLVLINFGTYLTPSEYQFAFGSRGVIPGLDIRNIWYEEDPPREKSLSEQLLPSGWPEFKISGKLRGALGLKGLERLTSALEKISSDSPTLKSEGTRMDFSQKESSVTMFAPFYTLGTNLSQLRSYATRPLLMRRFWAQQTGVFYLDDPVHVKTPERLNELARWFGISYVFNRATENSDLFREAGWEEFIEFPDDEGGVAGRVLKFPGENSLVELSSKPSILVIGQKKVQAYDQVFRLATLGVFPYKDTLLMWGKEKVDAYSLEELQNFDVLVLHGYDYSSRSEADQLLVDYVKSGGGVFIDTGWQYTVPDWETEEKDKALEVIPFERLSWVDPKGTGGFVLEDSEFGEGVDASKFGPLVYGDQPWSVSSGDRSDLKEGARVVLSVGGKPLVVVGQPAFAKASADAEALADKPAGKVVWSGMNIFPHAKQGATVYYDEVKLLANLFDWLWEGKGGREFGVSYKRAHPDAVEFTINEGLPNGGFLLWKEAFYPDFRSYLVDSKGALKIDAYRAGPVMTAIHVPQVSKGTKVVYQYQKPWFEKALSVFSIASYFLLLLLILEGLVLKQNSLFLKVVNFLEGKMYFLFFGIWKKPSWLEKGEEEEY